MIITLVDGALRCEFRYDARIVERMKTVPGATWDAAGKHWAVPAANADRVLAAFPLASYDYDALVAAWDAAARRDAIFLASLHRWGIELVEDTMGNIVAVGATVSPCIQELVTARAAALRPFATPQSDVRQGVLLHAV